MKVMTRGGKPLIKNGKVAITKDDGKACGPCCSGGCVPQASVTAAFSGISLCSSCVNMTASGWSAANSWIWLIDPGVNGSFNVPFFSQGSNFVEYSFSQFITGGGAGLPGDNFAAFADTSCIIPAGTGAMSLNCDAICSTASSDFGPGWYLLLSSADGFGIIFAGFVSFSGDMSNIANLLASCGSSISLFGQTLVAIGYGGTAVLTV